MTVGGCQRLVVVHGPADPVLASTLIFVGLHVVHQADGIAVWAPLEWELAWSLPEPGPDGPELCTEWGSIPMASATYPTDISMEDE